MLTEEQKKARRLGGSMIAAALGLSRWKTPLDAYLDVRGEAAEVEENANMRRGTFLEPALRSWTEAELTTLFEVPKMPLVHPDEPFFTYSPDGLELGEKKRLLEIKAPGPQSAQEWGAAGTDDIPQEYHLQTSWGLLVCNRSEGVVSALIGGELRLYRIRRDEELERKLFDRASAFIHNHVIPGIPPPATYGDDLRVIYPKMNVEKQHIDFRTLDESQQRTVVEYLAATTQARAAEKELDSKKVLVQDIIRDAPGIAALPEELGFTRIDWSESKPAMNAGTWKALAQEFLKDFSPIDQQNFITRFTPTEGVRRLTAQAKRTQK